MASKPFRFRGDSSGGKPSNLTLGFSMHRRTAGFLQAKFEDALGPFTPILNADFDGGIHR
ncbi:MAG: hypothetical protein ACYDC6_04290 [Acidobacteriaceae bacterium]